MPTANPAATATFRAARDALLAARSDYDAAVREFRWPSFETFNWATDWFDALAGEQPDVDALRIVRPDGETLAYTYADLSQRSLQLADWLRSEGVDRGDRVLVVLGVCPELWLSVLACIRLGAVMIPATTLLGTADLRDRVHRGGVKHVIAHSENAERFEQVPGDWTRIAVGPPVPGWLRFGDFEQWLGTFDAEVSTAASDTLLLYFTSGTTARPKLVEHTHASYPVGHLTTMYWLGLQPGDVHCNVSSAGWAKHAWSSVFAPWNAGATVLVIDQPRFDAPVFLDALADSGATTLCAPPTVWRMLVQYELSAWTVSLREVVAAGEPLNPEVIEQVRKHWNLTVRDGYGQTETTAMIGNSPGQEVKLGSMGRPLPGYPVALVDPLSSEVADDGEICIDLSQRPVGLMVGYHGDSERTDEAMRGGFFHTGDVATRDADGYITYVGRTDDVFKASDYRISPFELESVLVEHPAIAEAAVVPAPDPVRLAVPKAYVVLAAGWTADAATAREIFAHSRAHLAAYKRVRRLEFGELPKTVSGKIRRVELRGREREDVRPDGEFREDDFPDLRETF